MPYSRLRRERDRRGWTREEAVAKLAARGITQLSAPQLLRLESGQEPTYRQMVALADLYDLSPQDLAMPADIADANERFRLENDFYDALKQLARGIDQVVRAADALAEAGWPAPQAGVMADELGFLSRPVFKKVAPSVINHGLKTRKSLARHAKNGAEPQKTTARHQLAELEAEERGLRHD